MVQELIELGPTGSTYKEIVQTFYDLQTRFPPVRTINELSPSPSKKMWAARNPGCQHHLPGKPHFNTHDFEIDYNCQRARSQLLTNLKDSDTPDEERLWGLHKLETEYKQICMMQRELAQSVPVVRKNRSRGMKRVSSNPFMPSSSNRRNDLDEESESESSIACMM